MDLELAHNQKITDDSRSVQSGDIFVAVKGHVVDGHDFIQDAIKRGASTIIVDQSYYTPLNIPENVSLVISKDSKKDFSEILKRVYKIPKNLVGITGTNGKTSTAYFYKQITELSGGKSASVGYIRCCLFRKY